jgi:OOP family OmpA-OmpF porin
MRQGFLPLAVLVTAMCQVAAAQVPQQSYWEAKAQCWAQLAASERSQGDTHGTSATATGNAARIEEALKSGRTPAPSDEQPIYSRRIMPSAAPRDGRPTWVRDIVQAEATLGRYSQRACRSAVSACLEVALSSVYENMEESAGGRWNHGRPEIDHAVDLAQKAESQFDADCAPLPELKAVVVEAKPELPVVEVKRTLSADALFDFDSAQLTRAGTLAVLELAKALPHAAQVRIVGHTDRFGSPAYNASLSQRRAEAVRQLLVTAAPSATIDAEGVGSNEPVVTCPGPQSDRTIKCLAPNRRVVVTVNPQVGGTR